MSTISLSRPILPDGRTVGRLAVVLAAVFAGLTFVVVGSRVAQASESGAPASVASSTTHSAVPASLRSAIASAHGGAGLDQTFASDGGLHVHEAGSPSTAWSLVPVSLTRTGGGALPLHGSTAVTRSGTTTFAMGPLDAWYRSDAAGVEQGFTVSSRPSGSGATVSVALRSSGSLVPALTGGSLALHGSTGTPVLRYGSLRVTDATGRVLPAHLSLAGTTVRIVVRDAGAVYPLRVDPYTQQATLTASDGAAGDYFGASVAISGDGLTAIVGADNKTVDSLAVAGQAYVYTDSGGTWSQQQILAPATPSTDAFFGNSVALSADGDTAFVAAEGLTVSGQASEGGVYVFTRSGSTWTQRTLLTDSGGTLCDAIGTAIATDGAGTELLVGAKDFGGCSDHIGAALVFTGSGATWTQGATLASPTATPDEFGSAVALSTDGSTALIGAPFALGFQGIAYLYTGSGFADRQTLSDPLDHADDGFGSSLALSANGSTALVGDPYTTGLGGAGYLYSGPSYTSPIELTNPDSNGIGVSSALSADGSIAVLGNTDSNTNAIFEFSGPGYTTKSVSRPTTPNGGIGPYFGSVLGLSADGSTLITAGSGIPVNGNDNQGEAAIFTANAPSTSTTVGYWLAAADGAVKAYGGATTYGSEAGAPLNAPIVGLTGSQDGKGYWLVGADGGVFAFGDAVFHGSLVGTSLNAPIVGMVATRTGGGYWLVGADGGVFAYGNAAFHGSLAGTHLNAPIVGIAATADGGGYWLVGADGGVFAFGDASFHGSLAGTALSGAVVGIAPTADGGGYWLVGTDGSVHSLGDAVSHGSLLGTPLNQPVDDVVPTADGGGYALVAGDGGLFSFGDAPFYGSGVGAFPGSTVIGLAASNQT